MVGFYVESKNLCCEGTYVFTISFVTVSYFNKLLVCQTRILVVSSPKAGLSDV